MSDLLIQKGPPPEAPHRHRWWFQGPWFIIVIVVALLAGAAVTTTVLLSQPKKITVHGKVIDQVRPELGVATASVSTDGTTAKPDAAGTFTMTGIAENAVLRVSAPYYRTNTVNASTARLTIRLTPLPVALTVTSALTGAPLTAAVSAPAGQPLPYAIASGGTVRLYRAGPGETLTVTASGYQQAHAAVGADRTLTVALEPTFDTVTRQFTRWLAQGQYSKIVDWVLRPATGYTFEPPTPQEQAEIDKSLPDFQLYLTSRSLAANPAVWVDAGISKPGMPLNVHGYVKDVMGNVDPVAIAGGIGWHGGPNNDGFCMTAVNLGSDRGSLDLEVFGTSTAQTDQIMTRILTTLQGPSPSISA